MMLAGPKRFERRLAYALVLGLVVAGSPGDVQAQASCTSPAPARPPAAQWTAPLDRVVAFQVTEISLRDALDRLAAGAGLRISYSPDGLPISRPICYDRTAPVGDILLDLTFGSGLVPVMVGSEHVVLSAERSAGATESYIPRVIPLERVLVSGSPAGASQRGLAVAVDVLDTGTLHDAPRRGTVSGLLNPSVPGLWVWEQSPVSLLMRYASIRGASSFGASYPKIYIDGVEVANPLLLRRLIPETIERVEVIRGPQGAALHGMDAISGVINIVTRHGRVAAGGPEFLFRSRIGVAESDFRGGSSLAHEHAAAVRLGDNTQSAGFDFEFGDFGHVVSDGASRFLNASGTFRMVGPDALLTSFVRFGHESASAVPNPLLRALAARVDSTFAPASNVQQIQQYTIGIRARFYPAGRWDHTLVAGLDGDRIQGVLDDRTPLPLGSEVWTARANGGADRLTLRASSVGRLPLTPSTELRLTIAGEHSSAWERTFEARSFEGAILADRTRDTAFLRYDRSNAGMVLTDLAVQDRLYLTIGGRAEHRTAVNGATSVVALPVFGAAYVHERGDLTAKLRGAYGRGTRPVRTVIRGTTWPGSYAQIRSPSLDPEEQSGVEVGVDLSFGSAFGLQLTAFDQLASGLVQRVTISEPTPTPNRRPRRMPYALQNLGEISNRGWELEATARLGAFEVTGGAAYVDSRVEQTATGYTGDLRPGDRMLEVPRWTTSLSVARTIGAMSASIIAYRASDWVNYDRIRLARDFAAEDATREDFIGDNLRAYWREYDGSARVSATVEYDLSSGVSFVLAGDNLLDRQVGEPDNSAAVPGRTVSIGMRARF